MKALILVGCLSGGILVHAADRPELRAHAAILFNDAQVKVCAAAKQASHFPQANKTTICDPNNIVTAELSGNDFSAASRRLLDSISEVLQYTNGALSKKDSDIEDTLLGARVTIFSALQEYSSSYSNF